MKKVLFVRNVNANWALRDRDFLKEEYHVDDFFINSKKLFSFNWIIKTLSSEIVFCWFASFSYYPVVFLAKLLGKKVIIVSGGFDAAYAPSIGYGAFARSKASKFFRRKLFKMANKVICVSKANMAETMVNARVPASKCEVIYHGFEPLEEDVQLKPWAQRKRQVVMISQCDRSTFYTKGIDQFFKLARLLPEFKFILIGKVDEDLKEYFKKESSSNFEAVGFLPFRGKEFNQILNDSKFILQLSYYESFGCSVIDGVLMGCYPITSNKFALFEVAYDLGKTVGFGEVEVLAKLIHEIAEKEIDVEKISQNALRKFPLSARRKKLQRILQETV